MQGQQIRTHTFDNGLTLVVETMPGVQSGAFSLLVPAGNVYDPGGQEGCASVLCDLITRGAGERTSKQLVADLDNLGLQRHESVGSAHLGFHGATLAERLGDALKIYADVVLRPHLPTDQFDAARASIQQSLRAMEDEPRQKVMVELRRRCYPTPWGLPSDGSFEGLANLNIDTVKEFYEHCFRPQGAILGIAGNVDFEALVKLVGECFSQWSSKSEPTFRAGPRGTNVDHLHHDSTQTHIGIAYDSVPYRDEEYYEAWAAVNILSGGMSSRLFTEVREKRALCYSVYATMNTLRDEGRVLCYAGTTNQRAQETLDVTLGELIRLGEGIGPDELDRCKASAKSSLIMQQESSSSRASSIARDWYHLGRVTTLEEVRQKIDALSVESVLSHIHTHPAQDFTVLTLGPKPLEVSLGVS